MTIDKIKIAIGDYLWNFWQNNHDIDAIKRAEKILKEEIENGLRRRFCKLGIEPNLNLK